MSNLHTTVRLIRRELQEIERNNITSPVFEDRIINSLNNIEMFLNNISPDNDNINICVTGPIGAGKTYFTDKIKHLFPSVGVFTKPLPGRTPLIKLYYEDKTEWTPSFQHLSMNGKACNLLDANEFNGISVIERSIEDNCQVFALQQYELGFSTTEAWEQYKKLYGHLFKTLKQPDIYIYLKGSEEFLLNRIHDERKREGENRITLEYIRDVIFRYDTWIEELRERREKIYTIQVDHDFSDREIKDIFLKVAMAQEEISNEAMLLV